MSRFFPGGPERDLPCHGQFISVPMMSCVFYSLEATLSPSRISPDPFTYRIITGGFYSKYWID